MFREKFKRLIFQYVINNPSITSFFTTNYPGDTIPEHFHEFSLSDTPDNIKYVAIRYKLVKDEAIRQDKRDRIRNCILHFYIESARENSEEVDRLIEILREIFTVKDGRELGIYSEQNFYTGAFGADASLNVYDCFEISSDVIKNPVQSTSVKELNNLQLTGYRWLGILILSLDVEDPHIHITEV